MTSIIYKGKDYANNIIKKGVLYIHIRSAALRSQLFDVRYELVRKLNDEVGVNILKDIRLLA